MVLDYFTIRFKYWEVFFYISIILNKNALGATASVYTIQYFAHYHIGLETIYTLIVSFKKSIFSVLSFNQLLKTLHILLMMETCSAALSKYLPFVRGGQRIKIKLNPPNYPHSFTPSLNLDIYKKFWLISNMQLFLNFRVNFF